MKTLQAIKTNSKTTHVLKKKQPKEKGAEI